MATTSNKNNAAAEKAAAEKKATAEKVAAEKKATAEKVAAEKASKQGKTVMVPALSVVSSREGFRRAGRAWSKEATVVKLSELSKDQIKQLKGEAMLTVTEVEVEEVAGETQ